MNETYTIDPSIDTTDAYLTVNLYSQVFIIDADCKENKITIERI